MAEGSAALVRRIMRIPCNQPKRPAVEAVNSPPIAVVLCAVLVMCGCRSPPNVGADLQELDSVVVVVKGNARFRTDGGPWNEVKRGMRLKPGCEIQTANDSYVDIRPGSRYRPLTREEFLPISWYRDTRTRRDGIRLLDNTIIHIDKVSGTHRGSSSVDRVRLTFRSGELFCSTRTAKPMPEYEVRLTNAVVHATNAVFLITAHDIVWVPLGTVIVSVPERGISREVNASQCLDCTTGELGFFGSRILPTWFFPLREPSPPAKSKAGERPFQ